VSAEVGAATRTAGAFAFPVFIEVRDRVVLVAGDGAEAKHKAGSLSELGAVVRRWSPTDGPFDATLLDDALLAIVNTGDRVLDRQIAADARSRRVLVNTVDDIPACDWSAPAILRRGDLTVAVATGGVAPALAVRLRDRFAEEVGPGYGELLALFGELRPEIMATGRSFRDRRRLWYELVDGPALGLVEQGDLDDARQTLRAQVDSWLSDR
jgi:precorrin-2 dehydrogenase / sirohydrochlorin ferrochelatase